MVKVNKTENDDHHQCWNYIMFISIQLHFLSTHENKYSHILSIYGH